ncbi:MAG: hypothetical protein OEM82_09610 [Acidobacteriota bacterium]|nr:hypothetical protein [Acidobacteriota bacterium]
MNSQEFQRSAVKPVECMSRGWSLLMENFGLFLGIGFLAFLLLACTLVIGWFLFGPIAVGIYYVYLRQMRGEEVGIGMMFKGFNWFLPAMVVGLVFLLPNILGQVYRLALRIAELLAIYNPNELTAGAALMIMLLGLLVSFLTIVGSILAHVTLIFAFPLFSEMNLGLMETVKLSARAGWANAGGMILLVILEGLALLVGVLACLVGIFVAIPLIWAANTVAFRMVFPDTASQPNIAPPQPDQYSFQ